MATPVTLWFDVSCPYCWMTAQWIQEVEKVRDLDLEFTPMSLSVLNDGRDIPADYAEKMKANWGPARVFAKVKRDEPGKVRELYQTMGTMLHDEGESGKADFGAYDGVIAAALEKVGLDAAYAEVANTEEMDAELRAYHQAGMDAVGEDVGTPVVKVGEHAAFFGPVISRTPEGEEAGEVFDAVARLAQFPYFYSVNRARTEAPQVGNVTT
ncbi:MAG: disulfide bond formation protein DsbA [Mobilicoccus sp.]|nr:disulfide bond formation protein DsbA [Mobilicoccus sp.]